MLQSVSANQCQELGTGSCPCVLAKLDECLVCSHLQGKNLCDCDWQEFCVYLEYSFDKKVFDQTDLDKDLCRQIKILEVSEDIYLFFLLAPKHILEKLDPLSKVFLWPQVQPKNQRHPAIVHKAYQEEGVLVLSVHLTDFKDKLTLLSITDFTLETSNEPVILGLNFLAEVKNKNILLVASNFGELLLISLLSNLYLQKNNIITVFLNNPTPWTMEKMKNLKTSCFTNNDLTLEELITKLQPNYFCSLGSLEQHKKIAVLLETLDYTNPLIININE